MIEAMRVLAAILSVLAVIWLVIIAIAGKRLDVHRQRIAKLEAELAELEMMDE